MLVDRIDYLEARVGLHGLDDERYHTNIPKHLCGYVSPEDWLKLSVRLLESEFADLCDRVASESVKDEELISRMSAVRSRLEELRGSSQLSAASTAPPEHQDSSVSQMPPKRFVAEKTKLARPLRVEMEPKRKISPETDTSPVTAIESITQSLRLGMIRMGERIRDDTKHILKTQSQQEDSMSATGAAMKKGQQFRKTQAMGLREVAWQFVVALILVILTLYIL